MLSTCRRGLSASTAGATSSGSGCIPSGGPAVARCRGPLPPTQAPRRGRDWDYRSSAVYEEVGAEDRTPV